MSEKNSYYYDIGSGFIGSISGIIFWLYLLESEKMSNIVFRKNDNNELVFSLQNVIEYGLAPFKYNFFWFYPFLRHNWVVMATIGCLCGVAISEITQNSFNVFHQKN